MVTNKLQIGYFRSSICKACTLTHKATLINDKVSGFHSRLRMKRSKVLRLYIR